MSDNVASLFRSVVDRKVVVMTVGDKTLTIKEPSASIARKIFQLEANRSQRHTESHKQVLDCQERLQALDVNDAEFSQKVTALQDAMAPALQDIMAATFIADIEPILLLLGDQVTREWLENDIGVSQLDEISRAVSAVCDPKNRMGAGAGQLAPVPAPSQTP